MSSSRKNLRVFPLKKFRTTKERENKNYADSTNSESYEEQQIDPITILRKEIQDWRNHKEFNDTDDVYTTSSQKNDLPESQNENIYSNDDVT